MVIVLIVAVVIYLAASALTMACHVLVGRAFGLPFEPNIQVSLTRPWVFVSALRHNWTHLSIGWHMTAEDIAEIERQRAATPSPRVRYHDPAGAHPCAYCGRLTKMRAYTDLDTGTSWPACCYHCIDKWEPMRTADASR